MQTRRNLLRGLLGGAAASATWPLFSKAEEDQPLEFQLQVPVAHIAAVGRELSFQGRMTVDEEKKGVPLVFIFAGLVLLPYLAKTVLALRRDMVYGGVVIDLRSDRVDIHTNKALSGGVIIVVDASGEEHYYDRDEIENPTELMKVILSAK